MDDGTVGDGTGLDSELRAGIAIYNAGEFHAAHDAWEDRWLDLAAGTDDERLLHGLIQFTAAVYHARNRNWSGATGLAASAVDYLQALPGAYRGVEVAAVRGYLRSLERDPELIERRRPLALTHEGTRLTLDDLGFPAAGVAARVLAEELGYDESVLDDAVRFAREEYASDEGTTYISLVMDFATDAETRDLVFDRLAARVARRRDREADVEGLFDVREE